ncbi:MAG: hypothetical protein M5U19_18585 [Microthrixaceae bacterium]|nr:hypothetical protein [Microthrixaceae bacterium]
MIRYRRDTPSTVIVRSASTVGSPVGSAAPASHPGEVTGVCSGAEPAVSDEPSVVSGGLDGSIDLAARVVS